jgi:glutamyl-tRNA synthetase
MEEKATKEVVTRFAPSPTGFMHVGGVRTALYAWLWARKNNGQFILRIEDTDKEREVEGSIEHIKKSLKWLGLNWDQGPDVGGPHASYIQSERLPLYKKYAEILIKKGFAYADPYEEEEIDEFRKKSEAEKKPFLFREYRPENPPEWDGTMPLRFKVSELKRSEWSDVVWGELSAGPEALDDFILIKSDGYPTYNFAHIVDDIEMGVTHVVRGQEFISSTPKFLALYEALGVAHPFFVTVPPIMGADGKKKLGKRDGAKDIMDYEKEGYLPETMINYLTFLGFNPGGEKEVYTREELINIFDLNKIQHSGAQWSDDKLNWMNKEHIARLTDGEFVERAKLYINKINPEIITFKNLTDIEFSNYILQFKGRILKFGDLINLMQYGITTTDNYIVKEFGKQSEKEIIQKTVVILGPSDYLLPTKDPIIGEREIKLLIPKNLMNADVVRHLKNISDFIEKNNWEKIIEKNDENDLWVYAGKEGRGKVLWPLRVALSGEEKSPDPFEIMKAVGKDSSLRRIKNSLEALENGKKYDTQATTK